jgi:hypothetical protein
MEKIEFTKIEGETEKIIIRVPAGYYVKGNPTLEAFYPRGEIFLMIPVAPVDKGE